VISTLSAQRSAKKVMTSETSAHGQERESRHSTPNRSCEPCRLRKVRCQQLDDHNGRCMRCQKMGLSCTYTAQIIRQRRKRTETRVAGLERELRALQDRLNRRDPGISIPETDEQRNSNATPLFENQSAIRPAVDSLPTTATSLYPMLKGVDDWGCSELIRSQLIHTFFENLAPHLPFMQRSNISHLQQVHQNHPLLIAILAASAASIYPQLGRDLVSKLEKVYAHQVFMKSERSLELVQAFLITASWYHPPDQFKDLKFTQYAHMAANMALDLNLGDMDSWKGSHGWVVTQLGSSLSLELLERVRTHIACYLLCSRLALLHGRIFHCCKVN
jgi:Zn(2)-Cys(6) binuclear cluster domain-containing protein/transcription factor-like protein